MAPSEDYPTDSSSSEEELSETESEPISELDNNTSSATPATKNGSVLSGRSNVVCDLADQIIKNGWKLVEESKKSEWEKQSKELMMELFEIRVKQLELLREQAKLVSEAMKSAQE